jgi:hypothetical protein
VGQQGAFRVAFAPGVTPGKWLGIWKERERSSLDARLVEESDQLAVLRDGTADMCFVRLPVDREGLHVISLYREAPVVVLPLDHLLTVLDEVAVADLADEQVLEGADLLPGWAGSATAEPLEMPPMTTKQAIEVVASGTGIVVVPMSWTPRSRRSGWPGAPTSTTRGWRPSSASSAVVRRAAREVATRAGSRSRRSGRRRPGRRPERRLARADGHRSPGNAVRADPVFDSGRSPGQDGEHGDARIRPGRRGRRPLP